MAIVLPHGVLFRGNAEGTIRKALLEEGAIDTVIGLPANIFFNTSIPTTVIILKKNRTNRDVYFIDAFEEEEVEPLTEIVAKINQTNLTIESQTASLLDMLGQLHGTTPEADEELKKFVEAFKG